MSPGDAGKFVANNLDLNTFFVVTSADTQRCDKRQEANCKNVSSNIWHFNTIVLFQFHARYPIISCSKKIFMKFKIKHNRPHVSPIKLSARVIKTRFSNFCAAADVWSAAEQSTAVYTYAGTGSGAYLKEHSYCQQIQLRETSTISLSNLWLNLILTLIFWSNYHSSWYNLPGAFIIC